MIGPDFDRLLKARLDKTKATLGTKAGEYATAGDRLHNFKRAAAVLGVTPEFACAGFMTKHIVSVIGLVDGTRKPTPELIDEKVGDAINYLVLLEALLTEGLS